jgi:hypothetical protein
VLPYGTAWSGSTPLPAGKYPGGLYQEGISAAPCPTQPSHYTTMPTTSPSKGTPSLHTQRSLCCLEHTAHQHDAMVDRTETNFGAVASCRDTTASCAVEEGREGGGKRAREHIVYIVPQWKTKERKKSALILDRSSAQLTSIGERDGFICPELCCRVALLWVECGRSSRKVSRVSFLFPFYTTLWHTHTHTHTRTHARTYTRKCTRTHGRLQRVQRRHREPRQRLTGGMDVVYDRYQVEFHIALTLIIFSLESHTHAHYAYHSHPRSTRHR